MGSLAASVEVQVLLVHPTGAEVNACSSLLLLISLIRFRYLHIPLCLLYSSVTKFFLLFLLAVWDLHLKPADFTAVLDTPRYQYTIHFDNPIFKSIWEALDDDKLDRRWIVRNVLGGMAAGFGLRGARSICGWGTAR
jgi:hypothetical protein